MPRAPGLKWEELPARDRRRVLDVMSAIAKYRGKEKNEFAPPAETYRAAIRALRSLARDHRAEKAMGEFASVKRKGKR